MIKCKFIEVVDSHLPGIAPLERELGMCKAHPGQVPSGGIKRGEVRYSIDGYLWEIPEASTEDDEPVLLCFCKRLQVQPSVVRAPASALDVISGDGLVIGRRN